MAGQRRVWRGDVHGARATFVRLRALADERGEPISYALSRLHMCELELRVGRWDDAEHLLDEWAQSSDGGLLIWPMYERCRALLAAGRGRRRGGGALGGRRARARGGDAVPAGTCSRRAAPRASRRCSRHDPARAAERLGAVWDHLQREGVEEPGAFPVAPDLVEAHLALGAPARRGSVTGRLRALADQHEHPWARAGAARCEALIALSAEPYDEAAAASLAAAAADYAALGLPVEQARTLLALGRAQRRFKKWGAARQSLQACAEAFDALGSPGWAGQARSELGRVGARRPPPGGGLTPTERRVAELAAEGLSNKEIARDALRHRAHGREAPLEGVREARHPLARRARTQPLRLAATGATPETFRVSAISGRPPGHTVDARDRDGSPTAASGRRASAPAGNAAAHPPTFERNDSDAS